MCRLQLIILYGCLLCVIFVGFNYLLCMVVTAAPAAVIVSVVAIGLLLWLLLYDSCYSCHHVACVYCNYTYKVHVYVFVHFHLHHHHHHHHSSSPCPSHFNIVSILPGTFGKNVNSSSSVVQQKKNEQINKKKGSSPTHRHMDQQFNSPQRAKTST